MANGKETAKTEELNRIAREAKASMEERYSSEGLDIWEDACYAAGLTITESDGIPVQGERHLIASWAGVKAAIKYALGQTRTERSYYRTERENSTQRQGELNNKIDSLRDTIDDLRKENASLEKRLLAYDVHECVKTHSTDSKLLQAVDAEMAA